MFPNSFISINFQFNIKRFTLLFYLLTFPRQYGPNILPILWSRGWNNNPWPLMASAISLYTLLPLACSPSAMWVLLNVSNLLMAHKRVFILGSSISICPATNPRHHPADGVMRSFPFSNPSWGLGFPAWLSGFPAFCFCGRCADGIIKPRVFLLQIDALKDQMAKA